MISCSNKKRGLGDSKYNERRSECETALAELQKVVKIDSLGELTEEQFEQYKDAIKDPVRVKRAKHAVYENQRTIKAVEALKNNDVALFGELMNASHVSLRDDYEVTGIELDTLVEEAWKVDGVIGSRMTCLLYTSVTYSKLFGYKKAVNFVFIVTWIDIFTNFVLVWNLNKWSVLALLLNVLWCSWKFVEFKKNPTKYKIVTKVEMYTYIQESLMILTIILYIIMHR